MKTHNAPAIILGACTLFLAIVATIVIIAEAMGALDVPSRVVTERAIPQYDNRARIADVLRPYSYTASPYDLYRFDRYSEFSVETGIHLVDLFPPRVTLTEIAIQKRAGSIEYEINEGVIRGDVPRALALTLLFFVAGISGLMARREANTEPSLRYFWGNRIFFLTVIVTGYVTWKIKGDPISWNAVGGEWVIFIFFNLMTHIVLRSTDLWRSSRQNEKDGPYTSAQWWV